MSCALAHACQAFQTRATLAPGGKARVPTPRVSFVWRATPSAFFGPGALSTLEKTTTTRHSHVVAAQPEEKRRLEALNLPPEENFQRIKTLLAELEGNDYPLVLNPLLDPLRETSCARLRGAELICALLAGRGEAIPQHGQNAAIGTIFHDEPCRPGLQ